jgi:hypothetical protein
MYKPKKTASSGGTAAGPTHSGGAAAQLAGSSAPITRPGAKVFSKKRVKKVTPATQSKKVREPKKGMWWSAEELDMVLDIIADIKPTG